MNNHNEILNSESKKSMVNLFFAMLFLFSCSPSSNDQFSYKEYNLVGNELGPIDFFSIPKSIISDQGNFVISDESKSEHLFYLNQDFNIIRSLGRRGNGPDELDLPPFLSVQRFEESALKVLTGWPVKEVILSDSSDFLKMVNYPKDMLLTQSIIVVNDSIIWGQGGSSRFKFAMVNIKSGEILKEIPFPLYGDFFPAERLPFVFNGRGYYHPWWDRVVWVHSMINTIEFYFPTGDFEKEWVFGKRWTEEQLSNGYMVFVSSLPVPNGVLVMYFKEGEDVSKNPLSFTIDAALNRFKTRILFFNNLGEVAWSLKLDRFLNDFTFDVKNKRIVGVFGESEDRNIVVYELPEELLRDMGF